MGRKRVGGIAGVVLAVDRGQQTADMLAQGVIEQQEGSALGPRTAWVCGGRDASRRSWTGSWHHGASAKTRARVVLSALSRPPRVLLARL